MYHGGGNGLPHIEGSPEFHLHDGQNLNIIRIVLQFIGLRQGSLRHYFIFVILVVNFISIGTTDIDGESIPEFPSTLFHLVSLAQVLVLPFAQLNQIVDQQLLEYQDEDEGDHKHAVVPGEEDSGDHDEDRREKWDRKSLGLWIDE